MERTKFILLLSPIFIVIVYFVRAEESMSALSQKKNRLQDILTAHDTRYILYGEGQEDIVSDEKLISIAYSFNDITADTRQTSTCRSSRPTTLLTDGRIRICRQIF